MPMNRRELITKVGRTIKQKVQDPEVQTAARKKATETGIRQELEKVHGIKKKTQDIITDMVDLGDKGDEIIPRREFLNKVTDRAMKRNSSHRVVDIADSINDKVAKAVGKAGGVIKIAKNIGKKIRGKFSYMDDNIYHF